MYCICCQKTILPIHHVSKTTYNNRSAIVKTQISICVENSSEEYLLWKDVGNSTIDKEMIDGGIIQRISAGFGSIYDGSTVLIAICDDCIKSNLETGTVLFWGGDLSIHPNGATDIIENSKRFIVVEGI